jgi:GNAT superfamily N-acetyltransferase
MIKINPLLPIDHARVQQLLSYEEELLPGSSVSAEFSGRTFWQHWLPCNWHLFPSAYVAKEDGAVIGVIALSRIGKSASCWRIDHLVIHPEHRGRGLAVELLRYVFAMFGGQGISHFIAYVSEANSNGLRLFGSCGFRRAARVMAFNLDLQQSLPQSKIANIQSELCQATSSDYTGLFQLFQDVLPTDLRLVFDYTPDDFKIIDSPTYNKVRNKLSAAQSKYWLWKDSQRQVVTSAVKIDFDPELKHAQLTFVVHSGWKHQASDFVQACLLQLKQNYALQSATACIFDFDSQVVEALQTSGAEIIGHYCLLTREHWVRAKKVKHAAVGVPSIAKAAPI